MNISISIDDKRVKDLLTGHRGTYSPWLHELKWTGEGGLRAHVCYDREEDEEGSNRGRKTIGRRAILRGLTLMAKIAPDHFAAFIQEDDDGITFDCAMQCIIFGKLVYG